MEEEFLSSIDMAKKLGIHSATVSHLGKRCDVRIKKLAYHDWRYSLSDVKKYLSIGQVNEYNRKFINEYKDYTDFWKLDLDEFIVGCDSHVPFLHQGIFERMLQIAEKYKIKNFIHPGDFFDELQFSDFLTSPEDIVDIDEEIIEAKKICNVLTKQFKNVYFTQGNHDTRLWKSLIRTGKSKDTSWSIIWKLLDNNAIKYSKYRYLEANNYWRITHPKNIVKVGGLPAIRMRARLDRSLVLAHGHLYGEIPDPSSKYYIICPGCLCDPKKIAYANVWDTSHDLWHPGFMMVVERTKHILFDVNSPYGLYLGKSITPS